MTFDVQRYYEDRAKSTREGWIAALCALILGVSSVYAVNKYWRLIYVVTGFTLTQVGRTLRDKRRESNEIIQDVKTAAKTARIQVMNAAFTGQRLPGTVSAVSPASPEIVDADLAEQWVQMPLAHALVVAITRSGKTTFFALVIYYLKTTYAPHCQLKIIDPKGNSWLGLYKDQGGSYLYMEGIEDCPDVMQHLQEVLAELRDRRRLRMANGGNWHGMAPPDPYLLVLDEFNALFGRFESWDNTHKKGRSKDTKTAQLKSMVQELIFQGAQDNVFVWIAGQSPRVKELGISEAIKDNMRFISFARRGEYDAIHDSINNHYLMDRETAEELKPLLSAYKKDPQTNEEIPLCLTNIGGWRFVKLPNYRWVEEIDLLPEKANPWASEFRDKVFEQSEQAFSITQVLTEPLPKGFMRAYEEQVVSESFVIWLGSQTEENRKLYIALIDFAFRHGGLFTATEIKTKETLIHNTKTANNAFIRHMFEALKHHQIGRVEGEGNRLKWGLS